MCFNIYDHDSEYLKLCISSLYLRYDQWKNDDLIIEIINKNALTKKIILNNPELDEKTINCIILGFMIFIYSTQRFF